MVYSHRGPVSRSFTSKKLAAQRAALAGPWQDVVLRAIMDADPAMLAGVLRNPKTCAIAVGSRLGCKSVGDDTTFFILAERLYTACADQIREMMSGNYVFEDEEPRATTALWLGIIGSKTGDTLLHLVLRLNGVPTELKSLLAVELMGRGASFESENEDRELPSMVDPAAFKLAFFTQLPVWKTRRAAAAAAEKRKEANQKAAIARAEAVEARGRAAAERKRLWKAAAAKGRKDAKDDKDRDAFHKKLEVRASHPGPQPTEHTRTRHARARTHTHAHTPAQGTATCAM